MLKRIFWSIPCSNSCFAMQANSRIRSPNSTIRPDCSAASMNSNGVTTPSVLLFQRVKISK
ncbi:Uncharacterised protein [Vibrio cholerae]|nr:Uncharacterised protein [Vibrio cholerae]